MDFKWHFFLMRAFSAGQNVSLLSFVCSSRTLHALFIRQFILSCRTLFERTDN